MVGDAPAATKLWRGAASGDLDLIKAAVTEGADIDVRDSFGYAAIHKAAGALIRAQKSESDCSKFTNTIIWLVENGANVNAVGARGLRPLHILAGHPVSAEKDRSIVVPIAQLLLKNGAKVNAKAGDAKQSAMHYTSVHGRAEMIKLLLKHGAATNSRNYLGETPLHSAAASQKEEAIRLLVEAGARRGAKDKKNRTPLDVAKGVVRVENGKRVMPVMMTGGTAGQRGVIRTAKPKPLEPNVRKLLSNRPRRD